MRCLGGGVPMTGRGYNSNYQIVQSPGHVAILMEMMHDTRVIPLDGRPHLPTTVRSALGDSRGRWEGDTLVVETTNLKAGGRTGSSNDLHLVERFTRVNRDTLEYEYTMNDPSTWTRPWTARMYMRPAPGTGVLYEFACHEGNYAVPKHAPRSAYPREGRQIRRQGVILAGAASGADCDSRGLAATGAWPSQIAIASPIPRFQSVSIGWTRPTSRPAGSPAGVSPRACRGASG